MKRVMVIVASEHHGNTRKLVEEIFQGRAAEIVGVQEATEKNLNEYDIIGFASGIAFGGFYKPMTEFAEKNMPNHKEIFFLYTAGSPRKGFTDALRKVAEARDCRVLGEYGCKGFDTFGPFKIVGGINKGHPTVEEIAKGSTFIREILGEE